MKNKILIPFIALIFAACSGNKDKNKNNTEDKTSTIDKIQNISKISESLEESTKRAEDLKKITPLTTDALKALFADEIGGIKRTEFSVQNTMGYSVGEATYKKDDTTDYIIKIYDCAGEMGSSFYSLTAITKMNYETENENGYEKSVDFMGTKAMKSYRKNDNHYALSLIMGDRFWVNAESNKSSFEDFEALLKAFDFDKLKNIK